MNGIARLSAALLLAATALVGCSPQSSDNDNEDDGARTAPFEGAYTLELGALSSPGTGRDEFGPDPVQVRLMVRSACVDGCVATATFVDPSPELAAESMRFDYVDGRWVSVERYQATCGDRATEEFKTLTLEPDEDGRFTGLYRSLTASNNGCNADRPVTITRTGDLDPAIRVDDPAKLPPRIVNRAAGLRGEYRFQLTYTATGKTEPPIERTVATYCVRTGEQCVTLLTAENRVLTLGFADGRWTYQTATPGKCPDGRPTVEHDTSEIALPASAANPIPELTGVGHRSTDAPCPTNAEVRVTAERIGD